MSRFARVTRRGRPAGRSWGPVPAPLPVPPSSDDDRDEAPDLWIVHADTEGDSSDDRPEQDDRAATVRLRAELLYELRELQRDS